MSCMKTISSIFLLSELLQSYDEIIRYGQPERFPSLHSFLLDSEWLEAKLVQYVLLVKDRGIEVPELDDFFENTFIKDAVRKASKKVACDFAKYKEQMILQGPEKVFESSYYNDIASNIAYFFEAFEDQIRHFDDDSLMRILDCSLREGFFDRIMDYASDCESFDVNSLSDTADEIRDYCCGYCLDEAS